MIDSTVEVLCYWNGTILRTETDLRYIGNNVEIEPIDVSIHMTFVVLLNMIYDIIGVERHYQLVLKCRHYQPLTFLSSRLVQSPISSNVPSLQHPTYSDLPSVQPLTSLGPR